MLAVLDKRLKAIQDGTDFNEEKVEGEQLIRVQNLVTNKLGKMMGVDKIKETPNFEEIAMKSE